MPPTASHSWAHPLFIRFQVRHCPISYFLFYFCALTSRTNFFATFWGSSARSAPEEV